MFRRQPDRTPTLYYDVEQSSESEDGDNEQDQDDDYYSMEHVDIDEEEEEDQTNGEMNPDVTGAASSTNEETPKEPGPGDTSSIHSRDADEKSQKQNTLKKKRKKKTCIQKTLMIKASCVLW